jgi:cytochrome c peroxidase
MGSRVPWLRGFSRVALGALALGAAGYLSTLLLAKESGPGEVTVVAHVAQTSREPILPLEAPPRLDRLGRARARLGSRLFSERRLSEDDSLACSGCHDLAHGGSDARRVAVGVHGRVGVVNTPTVFNADLNVKQFWDGRADGLEAQIDGPVLNVNEMATTWVTVVRKLEADPSYVSEFAAVYPTDGITAGTVRGAIVAFERTLRTTGSRFDRFLTGEVGALSPLESRGYERFKSYGCVSCHQGRNVGGNLFERLGVMGDYFGERDGAIQPSDLGRYNVTMREEDRFKFRVPSLRLVAMTAPYFHDGRAATLEEAVVLMARYQLGESLPSEDVAAIVAFLGTLAGTYDPGELHADR